MKLGKLEKRLSAGLLSCFFSLVFMEQETSTVLTLSLEKAL